MIRTLEELSKKAINQEKCRMVVACAEDETVLEAVYMAEKLGAIKPVLVGDKDKILEIAGRCHFPVGEGDVIDVKDKAEACQYSAKLVGEGRADLIMKGFVDTSYILKAVLNKENGLRQDRILSHVLVLEVPGFDRLFLLTDSALNIAPDLEQKVSILKNAVDVAKALENPEPKVAVLCAVEKVNPKMQCTLDAAALKEMNLNGEITGCKVDGPLAMDNAVSPEAAKHKGISSEVAGYADILLAPDIEAGNMINKSMEYFAHAKKAGVIMGAKAPVVLTSRATSAESKMYSILLGIITASTREE